MNLETYREHFPSLSFDHPRDGILRVTLSAPGKLNAADAAMHRDLAYLWRDIDEDPKVRCVLIRGDGKSFSAGGDFSLIEEMIESDNALVRVWKEARDLVYNMVNCSRPVVSQIQGPAVGAGLAVALLADVSIAAHDARLLDGHTRLGVAAGDHAVLIWPLLCGLAKARYHLLTNTPVTGREAEQMGLVSLSVPAEELENRALEVAQTLAAGSPTALSWTKYALNNWLRMAGPSFDTSLALEFLGFRISDVKEGLSSLKEKRPPEFTQDWPR
jgi:enoyl-CoA hydratase